MRKFYLPVVVVVVLSFFSTVSLAQTTLEGKIGVAGLYYSADVPGSVGGFAALAVETPIERLRSFSGFNVFGADDEGYSNLEVAGRRIQYKIRTGLAYEIYRISGVSVHAIGLGGIVTNGLATAGAFGGGGLIHTSITKRFGATVILEAERDPINGTSLNPRFGFTFRF